MRKIYFQIIIIFLTSSLTFAGLELTTLWEKSAAQGSMTGWFDTGNLTRGMSYGRVDGNNRIYVVSRNGGSFIYILDAETGDSLGRLNNTNISGGTYHVSDVGVSGDGVIFVSNLSDGALFKIYKWGSEIDVPAVVVEHDHSGRLGDKITVVGSASDNSLMIMAASANSNDVLVFKTADNGATFMADTLDIGVTGGSSSTGPLPTGEFYWNGSGQNSKKFSSDGVWIGSVPGSVLPINSNAIRFITTTGEYEYLISFQYGDGNENARIVRVLSYDPEQAESYSITPTLGSNENINGTGDVSLKDNGDGTFNVFVLSTNNGLGAYEVKFPVPAIEPVNMVLNGFGHAGGEYSFFDVDNNTRGLGYNVVTEHILVASRTGGSFIYILDEETVIDTLNMTGVQGGTLPLNQVVADTTGVIYACNLASNGGTFKIYRWENEGADPVIAFEGTVTNRTGDSFSLSGTGTSTVIYASGTDSDEILIFTTEDGSVFTTQIPVNVLSGTARGCIAPVVNSIGSDLWINGAGTTLRKIDSNGNVIIEVPEYIISSSWMNVAYIKPDNGAKLIAVNANNIAGDRRKIEVWNVTYSESNPTLWAYGETWNIEQINSNGTGALAYKNRGSIVELLQLTTNNAVASWNLEFPLASPVETIADVKIDENEDFQPDRIGEEVTIRGFIISPNYGNGTQYYMQDETAGIQLYEISSLNQQLNFGDEIVLTGTIDQYRGSTEITAFTTDDINILSEENEVIPTKVKITDLGEITESSLVKIDSVWFVDLSQWPEEGSDGSVYFTDGTDTSYVYVDKETELDGWTPPSGLINIIGVSDQWTSFSSIYDDGYFLRGTFPAHFIDLDIPELPLLESFTDGTPDLDWISHPDGDTAILTIADSTASGWESHVGVFTDSANAGLLHVNNAIYENYTIESDIYIINEPESDFPLYAGLGVKIRADKFQFYRFVYRNSASYNGQLRLEGYDGENFHTIKYWDPGVDFEALQTGWHNFKVTILNNEFWAYIDDQELPGCPYLVDAIFKRGAPGIYKYDSSVGSVIFDNFKVTEPTFPPIPEPEILIPVWSLSQAAGTFPSYMSTSNSERGMAYGKVNGLDRVYVVTRNGTHRTIIYDAVTGDSVGIIPKPADAEGVGLFHLNCVDVSDDGIIFECNMTLLADGTHPFRVYRWDNESAEPQTAISYDAGFGRMGDMFSVHGSASDNSLVIYAGVANKDKIVKFGTNDNGNTFTPEVITLPENNGTLPNTARMNDTTFWIKSLDKKLKLYSTSGAVLDSVSDAVVGTDASKIAFFEDIRGKYILVYYPNVSGVGGNERVEIINVTNGGAKAYVFAKSQSIGSMVNGSGTGAVDFYQIDEQSFLICLLGTNNGVAVFTNDENYALSQLDTLFKGDTPVLHDNPFGEGYIVGTNPFIEIGKYQRFDFGVNDVLYGFRFYFAFKEIVGEPDILNLVVKSVAYNGAPDQMLTKVLTTTEAVDITGLGTTFFLPSQLKLSGPVFIGFEWSFNGDDEFALFADADGEGNGENRAWEQFSDGNYNDFGITLYPNFSWEIDVDLWIAAYYKAGTPVGLENEKDILLPSQNSLSQNYPNPFNPSTAFRYQLTSYSRVELSIYNMLGQKVTTLVNKKQPPGIYTVEWNAQGFASGVYLYRLKTDSGFIQTHKLILLK